MKHGPITAGRFPDVLSNAPEAATRWGGTTAYLFEPPARVSMTSADCLVSVLFSGTCRFRQEANGRTTEERTGPGAVHVMPAQFGGTWEGRERAGRFRAFALTIPESFLARVIAEDWNTTPDKVEIIQRFNTRDPVIEALFARLAFEVANGSPSGSIYAESTSEFLIHHLIHAHSSLARPRPHAYGGLPQRQLKRVVDYIEEHLSESITLRRLAELAGVSPRHFERAFRQALGVPPHAYVLQQRVAAARSLLVSHPTLPIHEVAARVGFCSASHLAMVFRRQTGQTPTEFRRFESS